MTELIGVPIVILMIAAYSLPVYAVLGLPGILVCLRLRSSLFWYPARRRLALSAAAAVSLAPYLVGGHSPVILPLPFGVALANHMAFSMGSIIAQALLSVTTTFAAVFIFLGHRATKAKAASERPAAPSPPVRKK